MLFLRKSFLLDMVICKIHDGAWFSSTGLGSGALLLEGEMRVYMT
jgi:hypothetical protein